MKNRVKDFYVAHEATLSSLHPGLNLHILTREVEWLNGLHGFHLNLENVFDELLMGKPLAYIVGYQYFFDGFFKVDSCTLIPRPESEQLVARALELTKNKSSVRFADIGTGTGAIGLSLAQKLKGCHGVLSDISNDVLEVAKTNFFHQQFRFSENHKVSFVQSDRFNNIEGQFDLIVSNPPYIKHDADSEQVSDQVKKFEPELALFLPDDEYERWFRDFFMQVADHLHPNAYFIMEGHESHLDDLAGLMGALNKFEEINVLTDLSGRARFLESKKHG